MNATVGEYWTKRSFLYQPTTGVTFTGYDINYAVDSVVEVLEKPGLFIGLMLSGKSCSIHADCLGEITIPVSRPVFINFVEQTLCVNSYRRGDFCTAVGVHLDFSAIEKDLAGGLGAVIRDLRDHFSGEADIEVLPETLAMNALADVALSLPDGAKYRELELDAVLIGFLAAAFRSLEQHGFADASLTEAGKSRADLVAQHLKQNLAHTPSLTELSKLAAVNPGTLTDNFRSTFGKTIFAYLRELRLNEARRILQCERMSITETAARVGFTNPTAFTTAYRRYFGYPPSHEQRAKPDLAKLKHDPAKVPRHRFG